MHLRNKCLIFEISDFRLNVTARCVMVVVVQRSLSAVVETPFSYQIEIQKSCPTLASSAFSVLLLRRQLYCAAPIRAEAPLTDAASKKNSSFTVQRKVWVSPPPHSKSLSLSHAHPGVIKYHSFKTGMCLSRLTHCCI